jgi:hypothetical protein
MEGPRWTDTFLSKASWEVTSTWEMLNLEVETLF